MFKVTLRRSCILRSTRGNTCTHTITIAINIIICLIKIITILTIVIITNIEIRVFAKSLITTIVTAHLRILVQASRYCQKLKRNRKIMANRLPTNNCITYKMVEIQYIIFDRNKNIIRTVLRRAIIIFMATKWRYLKSKLSSTIIAIVIFTVIQTDGFPKHWQVRDHPLEISCPVKKILSLILWDMAVIFSVTWVIILPAITKLA